MEALKLKKKNKYIKSLPLLLLCIPGLLVILIFHYIPLFGIVIAFKNYNYIDGILGSSWIAFDNFKFFFQSNDARTVIFNTIAYNVCFLVLNMICSVVTALLIYELSDKLAIKYFQTAMSLPATISFVLIAYIVYSLLNYDFGVVNNFLSAFGINKIQFYNEPKYWPFILIITYLWQTVGMRSLVYYSALMGIDSSLFEAAAIDGATRPQQIRHIAIPAILPVISIMLITGIGGLMGSGLGIFYQVPMNSATLYSATDVIATYTLRGLQNGNMGVTAAVGLFQNVVGLCLLLFSNAIIRKISPDNALI